MDTIECYCPRCNRKTTIASEHIGKKKQCKGCGEIFLLSRQSQSPPFNLPAQQVTKPDVLVQEKPQATPAPLDFLPEEPQRPKASVLQRSPSAGRVLVSAKETLPKSILANIAKAFYYPSTGIVQFVLLFVAHIGVQTIHSIYLNILVAGIIVGYYFTIIAHSASGRPYMPKSLEYLEDSAAGATGIGAILVYLQLLAILLLCGMLPLVYFGYVIYYGLVLDPTILGAVALPGLFILPMALIAVAIFQTIAALHPICLLRPLKRLPLHYMVICAVFYGMISLGFIASSKSAEHGVLAAIMITAFFRLYFDIIAMHMLGVFYWCYSDRFGWFDGKSL